MKKLVNLLMALVMVVLFVSCGFEAKKNPYIKTVEYTSNELDDALDSIRKVSVTTIDSSGNVSTRDFEGLENNILLSTLSTEYRGVTIHSLVVGISKALNEECVIELMKNEKLGSASISFIWADGQVLLSIPMEISKSGYKILEVPEYVVTSMERILKDKNIPQEEKDNMLQREYDSAWTPSLVVFGNMVDMSNIKDIKVDELIDNSTGYLNVEKADRFSIDENASVEFIEDILERNLNVLLPYNHMGEYMDTLMDEVFDKLGADMGVVNAMAGNQFGAFLSVTYYKAHNEIATLYFMLDEDLYVTEDISLEFPNGKVIKDIDVINYAR